MELKSQFFSLVLFCDCRKGKGEKKDLVMVVKGTRNLEEISNNDNRAVVFSGLPNPQEAGRLWSNAALGSGRPAVPGRSLLP